MKRIHSDLAELFYSDEGLGCWEWSTDAGIWEEVIHPFFYPERTYHIGREKPTEPPRPVCRMGGEVFPKPEAEPLKDGETYYYPDLDYPIWVGKQEWEGDNLDESRLKLGLVHKTKEAAVAHSKALQAVNKKVFEEAQQ